MIKHSNARRFFNWPPFLLVAIEADTGKPLDPIVKSRVRREYYIIGKDKRGSKAIAAHKSKEALVGNDEVKAVSEPPKAEVNRDDAGNNAEMKMGSDVKASHKGKTEEVVQDKREGDFAAEEDEKLKAIKAAEPGKPWKDIAAEMGRPPHVLKARFKEINKGGNDNRDTKPKDTIEHYPVKKDPLAKASMHSQANKEVSEKAKSNHDGTNEAKKPKKHEHRQQPRRDKTAEKQEQQWQQEQQGQQLGPQPEQQQRHRRSQKATTDHEHRKPRRVDAGKEHSRAKAKPADERSHSGSTREARFTMGDWLTLQEDDIFSFGELQCLSELLLRDERQRWLRMASAFFDKTGRRVHPDDIRCKFEDMAYAKSLGSAP